MIVKRNEIWLADLGTGDGSEQNGRRPVIILQNNTGNFFSPTVIVAAITDARKVHLPTHVFIPRGVAGIKKDSVILLEQIRTIDKLKLVNRMGRLPSILSIEADRALSVSLAMI